MENTKNNTTNVRVGVQRAHSEWVSINSVVPNPLNPRKDDAVKTDELQSIIKKRGWETPITVYQKGKIYVVLSGHRRLYAARQFGAKEIPVFIVPAPKTHQEEVERIASAQLASEDWTAMEWGKFTYERWLAWGRPRMEDFAERLNLPKRTVLTYVTVLDYYPLEEIEAGIANKSYHLSYLYDLVGWIRKVQRLFPDLVESLTEEMIRRMMLEKAVNKKVSRETIRKKDFLDRVSLGDMRTFFLDKKADLTELMAKYEFDIKEKSFQAQLISMGWARKAVKSTNPKNMEEAKKAFEVLKTMEESLKTQLRHIKKKYPAVEEKDSLF